MAIAYYTKAGYVVNIPLTDNARYDIVVEKLGNFQRVQCKTTNHIEKGSYRVALRTHGGNKTGTTTKIISKDETDLLFVYSFDGKWWEFPPEVFDNKMSLTLGPTKFHYQVS